MWIQDAAPAQGTAAFEVVTFLGRYAEERRSLSIVLPCLLFSTLQNAGYPLSPSLLLNPGAQI